jgi:hypothetical protein
MEHPIGLSCIEAPDAHRLLMEPAYAACWKATFGRERAVFLFGSRQKICVYRNLTNFGTGPGYVRRLAIGTQPEDLNSGRRTFIKRQFTDNNAWLRGARRLIDIPKKNT